MNIKKILNDDVKKYPNKPAIIFEGQQISFLELEQHVLRLAIALQKQGIKKSERIAFYLPNCPQYIYSYLACFCLGAVGVPLDFMLTQEELVSCLSHSDSRILIAMPKQEISYALLKSQVPSLEKIILLTLPENATTDMSSYADFVQAGLSGEGELAEESIFDSDPALIMYTSGTTGRPKGILLNYKHLEGSPAAMKHFVDLSDQDVKLSALPLSHIGGFIYIQNCILFGISLVLMSRFNPFEFLQNIQRYRVTCFHIVPAMYTALLTLKQIDQFDLSSLRWVVVFGAPSSPDILKRFHQYCPNAQLLNGWGMTETCPPNTVTPLGSTNIISVGKPAPHCQIKIVDENGQVVPAGEIGELLISGWIIMEGYYKDPETTAQIKRDGWLYTGDLARFDKDGFLYIVGRKKEMIKVGGQIVYAPEVEIALCKHEAVLEAAVIGIKDDLRGEAVKAFVRLKEGARVDENELRYFAKEHLAHFKVPQAIEIREQLPKNRVGKIDKEALKNEMSSLS